MYSPEITTTQALELYYQQNRLPSDGGKTAKWVRVQVGPIPFFFPNTKSRIQVVDRHDLHHIALDLGTTLRDEGRVAAWELGKGCGNYFVAWGLQLQALLWGVFLSPKDALKYFINGKRSQNLYFEGNIEHFFCLSVGGLRNFVLPASEDETADWKDYLQLGCYTLLGILLFTLLLPFYFFPVTLIFVLYLLFNSTTV